MDESMNTSAVSDFLELLVFSLTVSDGRLSRSVPCFESSSALYALFSRVGTRSFRY